MGTEDLWLSGTPLWGPHVMWYEPPFSKQSYPMPKCHIKSIFGKSSTSLPGYSKRWSLQRYPLRRCLPRQFTPISGAKSLKFSVGWLQRPTAGALSLEFLIVVENRTPWRVKYFESPTCGLLISVHPSDGDHELFEFSPWVRPLDNLSWATFSHITVEGIAARINVKFAQNERERSQWQLQWHIDYIFVQPFLSENLGFSFSISFL